MRAIKKIRKQITNKISDKSSLVLANLVLCLEEENAFNLNELYELSMNDFELALDLLKDWRLDRFYEGKAKLLDIALLASQNSLGQ